ncbi:MAG: hypothetical protein PVG27_03090 [Chloroflexota bacterium]|jgi:hypothetical protein
MARLPTSIDPKRAAELLADWGFLADPDLPDRPGPAFLLVAIRAQPTLKHYDPELVEYWITGPRGFGVREAITFASRLPRAGEFSWGRITVCDRKGAVNRYLTFGGTLRAERIDGEVICVFESPAPLLRRGGHSQGWDTGAHSVGGFLGRFRAAAGYQHEFEVLAAQTDPITRYAAFVNELVARYRSSEYLRDHYLKLWTTMVAEERRLKRDHPLEWAGGAELLEKTKRVAAGGSLTRQLRPF